MQELRTGFIGLGQQGGPMAERMIDAGLPVTLWARRPEALAKFVAKGALAARSISDLGANCDYVAICVIDDTGVQEICSELIPAMRPGSLLVIHSTILPETCAALAEQCEARGIECLDAPVSGGGGAAAEGRLTAMCGGSVTALGRARPALETFAGTIVHLGAAGSAQRAKIVNNALMAANMGLAYAACAAAEDLGIDRAAFVELVKQSSGRSFGFDVYARLPTPAAFSHGAPLLVKDTNLLGAILPDSPEAALLRGTAETFLDKAMQ